MVDGGESLRDHRRLRTVRAMARGVTFSIPPIKRYSAIR